MVGKNRRYSLEKEKRQDLVQQVVEELAPDREVVFAYVYGSFVNAEVFHDIDLGVHIEAIGPEEATQTALTLAERLSNRVGFPVDVRLLNQAPVSFLYHVLRGQLILCRDHEQLAAVIEDTTRHYLDRSPLLRQATKEAYAA